MKKVQIAPAWTFRDEQGRQLEPQLFAILGGVHDSGKLTQAAEQAGISYRHAWNLLNKWAAFFGAPLVELQKGRGASLTRLGEKLLWAEQRIAARLTPQLDNLASELNMEIQRTLEGIKPVLRLHASHGYAVAELARHAADYQLDLQYMSAEEALASFSRGQCDVAGFHLPVTYLSQALYERYLGYLKPRAHRLIQFITRQQGLMVKADNPLAIHRLDDLCRPEVRFINREQNAGTRALLDEMLRRFRLEPKHICGYITEEYTHSAVAAHIAAGMADAGFGVKQAAVQFGLGFIPLEQEQYWLVCRADSVDQAAMSCFIQQLYSQGFQQAVEQLAGYCADNCGNFVDLGKVFDR
ncbi:MAG: helix-turn-helix transcriptional regulator [Marinobacterium sp.]|nr:helix-turn-helix transcriptional regulator [Marinobacterium sp.]